MSSATKQATMLSPQTAAIYSAFANKLGMDEATKAEFMKDLQDLKTQRLSIETLLNLPLNDATTKVHLRYESGKNAHYLRVFGNVCPETGAFLPVSFKRYGTRAAYIQAVTHND